MNQTPFALIVTTTLLAVACGARSELATSELTTEGTGGSGGGPELCTTARVAAPILTIEGPEDAVRPRLVNLTTEPPTVAVVHSKQNLLDDAGPTLRVATFPGWGAWPPSIATVDVVDEQGSSVPGDAFRTAPAGPAAPGSFVLSFRDEGEVWVARAVDAVTGSLGEALNDTSGDVAALATSTSLAAHATAAVRQEPGDDLSLHVTFMNGSETFSLDRVACGKRPVMGIAPGPNGWLAGMATGTNVNWQPVNPPCTDQVPSAEPSYLEFLAIDPSGHTAQVGHQMSAMGTASRIEAVPRSDGAWIAWSIVDVWDIHVVRLDAAAGLAGYMLATSTVERTISVNTFAIDRFGDLLVFAADSMLEDGSREIVVWAASDEVPEGWSVTIPTQAAVDGPISIVASPAGGAYLVAWAEQVAGAQEHRLRVARVECVGEP